MHHSLPGRPLILPPPPFSSPGEELLARPKLHQGGAGEQRHPAHQRPRHPRGVPLRNHVRGAEPDHAGHPHGRAGHHRRGGGQPVHGSRAEVRARGGTQTHHIPGFNVRTLYRFAYEHITPVNRETKKKALL